MLQSALMIAYWGASWIYSGSLFSATITLPLLIIIIFNSLYFNQKYVGPYESIWLSAYLFFVVGPVQALDGTSFKPGSPVYGLSFSEGQIIEAMFLVFSFFAVLTAFRILLKGRRASSNYVLSDPTIYFFGLIGTISFWIYVLLSGGIIAALTPRLLIEETVIKSDFAGFFFGFQLAATFIIIASTLSRRTIAKTSLSLFMFFLLIVCQNPFNAARYSLLATYLPILLILLHGRIRTTDFYVATVGLIIFVMPILSVQQHALVLETSISTL